MCSIDSLMEISHNYEGDVADFERNTSIMSAEENIEISKENIWSFTLINVASSIVALVSIFMIETINLSFVGYTEENSLNLEAVGIGNILLNFTSLFLVFGALGALDTVGSFCYGKRDFINLGVYTIRMRIIIMICFFVFTVPSCVYTEFFLKALNIEDSIAYRAGRYSFTMLPAIFFTFNFNLNVRYLQVMHDYFWVSLIAVSSVIFHYFCNHFFFAYVSNTYLTVAYVSNLTTMLAFTASSIYIAFFGPNKESFFFYHPTILSAKEFVFFLKLALFSSLQHYGDFIGYEVVTFLGVYLPDSTENSASLVLLNYSVITSYLYSGSSYPLGQIVGYCLGKEDESFYKYVCYTYAKLNIVIGLALTAFTIGFADDILLFYTRNAEIIVIAKDILILYAIFSIIDNFNVMFQSILRGSGNQHIPSLWNVLMTCFVTIPVSYVMAFVFDFGVIGLWSGIFCFMTVMLIISFYFTYTLDFHENARKIKEEIHGHCGGEDPKIN